MTLNSSLQPENAPVTQEVVESGYDFNSQTERGVLGEYYMGTAIIGSAQIKDASITNAKIGTAAIGTANIGTLTFNEISGGTASLGGTLNGDGVLSVSRSDGTEVVRIDNTGIVVNAGSITIKNTSGSSVIDSLGINSTNSFVTDSATKSSNQTITGTGVVDVSGLSLTFSLSRNTKVLFMATITGYHNDADGVLIFNFDLDGTNIGPSFVVGQTAFAQMSQTATAQFTQTVVGSGSHTIKIEGKGNNSSPSFGVVEANFLPSVLTYLILGS